MTISLHCLAVFENERHISLMESCFVILSSIVFCIEIFRNLTVIRTSYSNIFPSV